MNSIYISQLIFNDEYNLNIKIESKITYKQVYYIYTTKEKH